MSELQNSRLLSPSSQILIPYPAPQAILSVAVCGFKLDESLRVGGGFHVQSAVLPHPYYMVVFGRKLLKETISAVYKTLARLITAVCEQHGHGGIDE